MGELKYPLGIQTFSEIIKEGFVYVDKTSYIKPLLKHGKYIFLNRPRRFGKSLLLSTLKPYFEGRRELFKGLAAEDMDLDWTPSPVLRFDLNSEDFSAEDGLYKLLNRLLGEYENQYQLSDIADSLAGRFSQLIRKVADVTGRRVVILIDDYDKPLLEIEDNERLFEKNQNLLKSFFGNLKSMDEYIRFAFITGLSRFRKLSLFSDLNHLRDISMDDGFADICGWTEKELIDTFRSGIEDVAKKREEDFYVTLKALRDYYGGFLFTEEGSRLYNPYSVLSALAKKRIDSDWFATGIPTFLVKRIKACGTYPPDVNGKRCPREELLSVGLHDRNPIPLMFQTGYLTIDTYNRELNMYVLRFPNYGVEIAFKKLWG